MTWSCWVGAIAFLCLSANVVHICCTCPSISICGEEHRLRIACGQLTFLDSSRLAGSYVYWIPSPLYEAIIDVWIYHAHKDVYFYSWESTLIL